MWFSLVTARCAVPNPYGSSYGLYLGLPGRTSAMACSGAICDLVYSPQSRPATGSWAMCAGLTPSEAPPAARACGVRCGRAPLCTSARESQRGWLRLVPHDADAAAPQRRRSHQRVFRRETRRVQTTGAQQSTSRMGTFASRPPRERLPCCRRRLGRAIVARPSFWKRTTVIFWVTLPMPWLFCCCQGSAHALASPPLLPRRAAVQVTEGRARQPPRLAEVVYGPEWCRQWCRRANDVKWSARKVVGQVSEPNQPSQDRGSWIGSERGEPEPEQSPHHLADSAHNLTC